MGHEETPGVYPQKQGALYRLDGGKFTTLADKISISNGLAWDLQEKAFYYTDSLEKCIRKYDYDVDTGYICEYLFFFCVPNRQCALVLFNVNVCVIFTKRVIHKTIITRYLQIYLLWYGFIVLPIL